MAFKKPGAFFKPADGRYIVDVTEIVPGPSKEWVNKQQDGTEVRKLSETMRWVFSGLRTLDGDPVIDPKTDEQAKYDQLSSNLIAPATARSKETKAHRWLRACHASKGLVLNEDDEADEMVKKALPATVMIQVDNGKVPETGMEPAVGLGQPMPKPVGS